MTSKWHQFSIKQGTVLVLEAARSCHSITNMLTNNKCKESVLWKQQKKTKSVSLNTYKLFFS